MKRILTCLAVLCLWSVSAWGQRDVFTDIDGSTGALNGFDASTYLTQRNATSAATIDSTALFVGQYQVGLDANFITYRSTLVFDTSTLPDNPVQGKGLLITGANAGTAQFRFRSELNKASVCKAGSIIIVRNIR